MARVHINPAKAAQLQVELRDEASGALLADGHFVVGLIPEGQNQTINDLSIRVVNNFQEVGVDTAYQKTILAAEEATR